MFAVDLSDGIRQEQPLGGLLGYRIERGMHEAGLDRLMLSLRMIAPLSQGKLTDRNENVPQEAVEALAPTPLTMGGEELPREGVRVRREPALVRPADGECVRWITRRGSVGRAGIGWIGF